MVRIVGTLLVLLVLLVVVMVLRVSHLVVRRRQASVLGVKVEGRLVGDVLLVLHTEVNHVRHRKLAVKSVGDGRWAMGDG